MKKGAFLLVIFLLFVISCSDDESDPYADVREYGEQFSGGEATTFDESVNAFGNAAPNLTGNKSFEFVTGNSIFKRNWVTAPASTEELDGLGPLFNARSCSACHLRDGRSAPPLSPTEDPLGLLFQLSINGSNGPEPSPFYGAQFNHRAILGVMPEGNVSVSYTEIQGTYPDGKTYSLRQPIYTFQNLNYGDFPTDLMISPRVGQQIISLGLLEAIDEATLMAMADPNDMNGDGISGKVNRVTDNLTGRTIIGRFGWKANQPNVRQQVAAAFANDIGITSSFFSHQPCGTEQVNCNEALAGGTPELTQGSLDRVTLYTASLAVPRRRNWDEPEVLRGKLHFKESGCTNCHVSQIKTGSNGELPEFFNQTIFPYTDMLLHDMGAELADGRPDGLADGNEWRTPPLWGMGLLKTVSGHTFLLHDGRARNVEEAILWHGGEAESSKKAFMGLTADQRESVLTFINSL